MRLFRDEQPGEPLLLECRDHEDTPAPRHQLRRATPIHDPRFRHRHGLRGGEVEDRIDRPGAGEEKREYPSRFPEPTVVVQQAPMVGFTPDPGSLSSRDLVALKSIQRARLHVFCLYPRP